MDDVECSNTARQRIYCDLEEWNVGILEYWGSGIRIRNMIKIRTTIRIKDN